MFREGPPEELPTSRDLEGAWNKGFLPEGTSRAKGPYTDFTVSFTFFFLIGKHFIL